MSDFSSFCTWTIGMKFFNDALFLCLKLQLLMITKYKSTLVQVLLPLDYFVVIEGDLLLCRVAGDKRVDDPTTADWRLRL